MQYYGINENGETVYVGMSIDDVVNYAKNHPEENIVRVEDRFRHGYNITEQLEEAFDKPPHEFWYFTRHGLGPGTLPKGVEILDVKEDDNWGTYIKLDKVLTTQELEYFDLKEKIPPTEEYYNVMEEAYGDNIDEMNKLFYDLDEYLEKECDLWINDIWPDSMDETITVLIENGDWKHDHLRLNHYIHKWAEERGHRISIEEVVTDEDGSDTYSSQHIVHFFSNEPMTLKLRN